jgi:hypothetical protein
MNETYQILHFVSRDSEYIVIKSPDCEDDNEDFCNAGFKLESVTEVTADLSTLPLDRVLKADQ